MHNLHQPAQTVSHFAPFHTRRLQHAAMSHPELNSSRKRAVGDYLHVNLLIGGQTRHPSTKQQPPVPSPPAPPRRTFNTEPRGAACVKGVNRKLLQQVEHKAPAASEETVQRLWRKQNNSTEQTARGSGRVYHLKPPTPPHWTGRGTAKRNHSYKRLHAHKHSDKTSPLIPHKKYSEARRGQTTRVILRSSRSILTGFEPMGVHSGPQNILCTELN